MWEEVLALIINVTQSESFERESQLRECPDQTVLLGYL